MRSAKPKSAWRHAQNNTAFGYQALYHDTTGFGNTAQGASTLRANTTGYHNRNEISAMGDRTEGLENLRPVTFHYKSDAQGTLQYGLIAEEVAKVYRSAAQEAKIAILERQLTPHPGCA